MSTFKILLALCGILLSVGSLDAAPPEAVRDTVSFLIKATADSGLTFIRNGSEHTSAEAASLMRRKYEAVSAQVKTAEDFIRLAATESHLSGKPYLVRTADGKTVPSAEWLTAILEKHRSGG